MTMLALLHPTAIVLAHASEVPHVHPQETGVALGLGLVLAFIIGSVLAMLKRKPAAS
jgi:Mg/Co/Ni transporter MgtE